MAQRRNSKEKTFQFRTVSLNEVLNPNLQFQSLYSQNLFEECFIILNLNQGVLRRDCEMGFVFGIRSEMVSEHLYANYYYLKTFEIKFHSTKLYLTSFKVKFKKAV